jgi:hypothetical protein
MYVVKLRLSCMATPLRVYLDILIITFPCEN